MKAACPQAQLQFIDRGGYTVAMSAPEKYAVVVDRFLGDGCRMVCWSASESTKWSPLT